MKTNIYKLSTLAITFITMGFVQSCGPNLARTNARIEKGFELGGSGTYQKKLVSTYDKDKTTNYDDFGQAELDLQYGGRREKDNVGFAAQLKLGYLADPSLDFYVEGPSSNNLYYGVGVEVGTNGIGGYAISTYYFEKQAFLTITGRVLLWDNTSSVVYNPQLSLGWEGNSEIPTIAVFVGYEFFTDPGLNLEFCPFDDCSPKYATQLIYGGGSVRF
jgi:hypothetical protein